MAILKGFCLAWEARFSKLEINMDSQVVVKRIQEPRQMNQPLYFIIKECQDLLFNQVWEIRFNH